MAKNNKNTNATNDTNNQNNSNATQKPTDKKGSGSQNTSDCK